MPCIVNETPQEIAEAKRLSREAITGPLNAQIHDLTRKLEERDAMLCAVMTVFENGTGWPSDVSENDVRYYDIFNLYDRVNWKEAGITSRELDKWWAEHKERDNARKEREAVELMNKRNKALNKLTFDERILLGLPGKLV